MSAGRDALPPDTLRVRTPEHVSLGYSTAGVGSRVTAQLIDNLLALVLVLGALLGYVALAGAASAQGAPFIIGGAVAFATFVYFAYFFISELASGGRTLGKSALGLRVLRVDGSAPDFAAIAVRNIVRILDITGVGLVVMFFHSASRRLGDLAAGTVVVRETSPISVSGAAAIPAVVLRTPDAGPPIDGLERLGPRERDAVRVFLSRAGLAPALRHRLAADMTLRLCDRMQLPAAAPERMWPPELFLERLYLQLEQRRS